MGRRWHSLGVIFFQSLTLRWFLSAERTQQMELGGKGEAESGGDQWFGVACVTMAPPAYLPSSSRTQALHQSCLAKS